MRSRRCGVSTSLGETIALPDGVASPWTRLAQLSSLLLLAFVVDASVALWRRGRPGDRRRAVVVGGSITVFILLAAGVSALILETTVKAPYFVSFSFLAIIVAMSFELSRDMLRSAQLAGRLQASEGALRESEQRMELAASAAELGLWVWEIDERCDLGDGQDARVAWLRQRRAAGLRPLLAKGSPRGSRQGPDGGGRLARERWRLS